ncbi:MAG: glycoside hydrolase family 15 protein [Anaerolineae bacterium]
MTYQPIENYGIIGDLNTVALVGMDGSIDFMCFPFFDSPSIFARLLDQAQGGYFQITPVCDGARQNQLYLPDTNVLLTRFLFTEGVAEVSDFMPVEPMGPAGKLVRRAKTIRGSIRYRMSCRPAFDYARVEHRVELREGQAVFHPDSPGLPALRLRSSLPLQVKGGVVAAEFTLEAGETASFILEAAGSGQDTPAAAADYVPDSFKTTVNYWREWIRQSQYQGRWREIVNRSALVLKMLISWRHGSIVAAPTFGLPEEVGGTRNWDYRYTWIRDTAFTLDALTRLGYTEEAGKFMRWIEERCQEQDPNGPLQTVYRLDGRRQIAEQVLSHLEGYRGSSPVRIGNAAYRQLQIDIYGEILEAINLHDRYGSPISHDLWTEVAKILDWVCENWQRPDASIWEVRGEQQHFLHSRVMSWVALDRGLRLARRRSLPAPVVRWRGMRDDIYRDIFASFWDGEQRAFVQYRGATALDAASLLMPLMGLISSTDPLWLDHLDAVKQKLVMDSLVQRYDPETAASDGLAGREGTFNLCTFWFVECLSRAGQVREARFYFEKMLGYANHLGLFAEETSARGEHLGNYPQAFTHLSLIRAACEIDRRLSQQHIP